MFEFQISTRVRWLFAIAASLAMFVLIAYGLDAFLTGEKDIRNQAWGSFVGAVAGIMFASFGAYFGKMMQRTAVAHNAAIRLQNQLWINHQILQNNLRHIQLSRESLAENRRNLIQVHFADFDNDRSFLSDFVNLEFVHYLQTYFGRLAQVEMSLVNLKLVYESIKVFHIAIRPGNRDQEIEKALDYAYQNSIEDFYKQLMEFEKALKEFESMLTGIITLNRVLMNRESPIILKMVKSRITSKVNIEFDDELKVVLKEFEGSVNQHMAMPAPSGSAQAQLQHKVFNVKLPEKPSKPKP